ncbi:MAG TPA: hypothetical protein VGF30_04920 [Bacteroidia bacterium]
MKNQQPSNKKHNEPGRKNQTGSLNKKPLTNKKPDKEYDTLDPDFTKTEIQNNGKNDARIDTTYEPTAYQEDDNNEFPDDEDVPENNNKPIGNKTMDTE